MGLDLSDNGIPASEDETLSTVVETAIRHALDLNRNTVSFNTAASLRGHEAEVADVCAELKKKFPALQEIVPSRLGPGATVYLNKKPSGFKKFVLSLATAEV